MTKKVRIENADTSNSKVVVQVWDGQPGVPPAMVLEVVLGNPCDLTGADIYVTDSRYLVVREMAATL